MRKFNSKRRLKVIQSNIHRILKKIILKENFFKSIILASISSHKWQRPILKLNEYNTDEEDEEYLIEQNQTHLFLEDQASSIG